HRFIVNNSPDLIYILDEEGNFSFVNRQVQTLLGYEPEELLGRHISTIIAPEDRERIRRILSLPAPLEGRRRAVNIAVNSRHPKQGRRDVEVSMWPIAGTAELSTVGKRYRTHGMARDITERLQGEALISFQTYHGLLTPLPNRALFPDR